jgi:hypothetical protein
MIRRPVTDTVEDFHWTYADHGGDLVIASQRLGLKPLTLAQALYRAKRRGIEVKEFYDNTQQTRRHR